MLMLLWSGQQEDAPAADLSKVIKLIGEFKMRKIKHSRCQNRQRVVIQRDDEEPPTDEVTTQQGLVRASAY